MKNKLLPLLFVLGSFSAYSQVVVGKLTPTPSAQLEVYANDKGMLIPRVALTSSTDNSTIKEGNIESLLVFNTASVLDIKPGYYYWYAGMWNRIVISGETTGMAGINGVPGKDGVDAPAGATIVVDNTTGIVYILKPGADPKLPDSWMPINGKNGNNGKDGITGGTGVPGA